MVAMTAHGKVMDLRGEKPHRYQPKLSDYLSLEWEAMTGEQFERAMRRHQASKAG